MRAEMMVNVSGGMGFSMPRNVDLSTTSFEDESDRTAIVYFSNLVNESLGIVFKTPCSPRWSEGARRGTMAS